LDLKRIDWKIVAIVGTAIWLLLMVGASYLSYTYKDPVRTQDWKPR